MYSTIDISLGIISVVTDSVCELFWPAWSINFQRSLSLFWAPWCVLFIKLSCYWVKMRHDYSKQNAQNDWFKRSPCHTAWRTSVWHVLSSSLIRSCRAVCHIKACHRLRCHPCLVLLESKLTMTMLTELDENVSSSLKESWRHYVYSLPLISFPRLHLNLYLICLSKV